MILSRAPFGVVRTKFPGVISWLTLDGLGDLPAIMAVLATTPLQTSRLGQRDVGQVIAAAVVAAMIVPRVRPARRHHRTDAVPI